MSADCGLIQVLAGIDDLSGNGLTRADDAGGRWRCPVSRCVAISEGPDLDRSFLNRSFSVSRIDSIYGFTKNGAARLPIGHAPQIIIARVLVRDSAFGYRVRMIRDSFSRDCIPTFDVLIVGAGATGALVALRMAEHGLTVSVLEAGPRFSGPTALQNTEANAGKIMWSEPRNFVGSDFVIPKAGTGVGGGTLPWLGVAPRFHRDDFRTLSTEGVGADWPIGYDDLRPHYEKVEQELGVAGECGPFAAEPYKLPMPPHRMNWHAQLLARGALKLGAHPFAPPIAINSVERDGRPACISCGWCGSGCPTEAKATAANTYLAKAEQLGARVISEAFVHRVDYDSEKNRVTGVEYLDAQRREHRIKAKVVVLAAHAIETPRLLLLSVHRAFPEGLANSSGLVGKNFMSHPTWQVFGTFDEPVNAFKGMQMGHVMVQDYYRPDHVWQSERLDVWSGIEGFLARIHAHGRVVGACGRVARRTQRDHARSGGARRARPACRARCLPMG
jgi:ferredoxin